MLTRRTAIAAGLTALLEPAPWGDTAYAEALGQAWGGRLNPALVYFQVTGSILQAEQRADRLLRAQGLAHGTVAERLGALFADGRFLYPDDDAGRDRAVADMNGRLAALRPRLPAAFGDLPIPPAQVRRMTPADVAVGRAGFRQPPKDGAPGAYYVDLAHIRARPAWTLPSAAFHEVTPGHLLQIPTQQPGREAGAFFEAWATYAEELAADLGAYRGDSLGELGYLHWRLFRLGRVAADVELGAMGSKRDAVIANLRRVQGPAVAFVTIEADVDRMAKAPGKVAAEGFGAIKLGLWRPAARAKWPAYHRLVLTEGPWRFADLERRLGQTSTITLPLPKGTSF